MYICGNPPRGQGRRVRYNSLASFSRLVRARIRLGYEVRCPRLDYNISWLIPHPKFSFIAPILWVIAVTFIRSSIILLYIPIFGIHLFRLIRLPCFTVLMLNTIFCLAAILAEFLICCPLACRFDYTIPCRSYGNQAVLDLFNAVFNILLDIVVVLLSIPTLLGLQMAMRKRLMLTGIFGLGLA